MQFMCAYSSESLVVMDTYVRSCFNQLLNTFCVTVCACVCVWGGGEEGEELLQTHPYVQGGGSCLPISSSQVKCSDANLVLNIHTGSLLEEIANTVSCTSAEGKHQTQVRGCMLAILTVLCIIAVLANRLGGKVSLHCHHLLTWQLSAAVFVLPFQTGS